jgi:hypothetical protein
LGVRFSSTEIQVEERGKRREKGVAMEILNGRTKNAKDMLRKQSVNMDEEFLHTHLVNMSRTGSASDSARDGRGARQGKKTGAKKGKDSGGSQHMFPLRSELGIIDSLRIQVNIEIEIEIEIEIGLDWIGLDWINEVNGEKVPMCVVAAKWWVTVKEGNEGACFAIAAATREQRGRVMMMMMMMMMMMVVVMNFCSTRYRNVSLTVWQSP